MLAYCYKEDTKEFSHSEECQLDPLERKLQNKDIYLLPANSTTTSPPKIKKDFAVIYKENDWQYIADHRGEQGFVDNEPFEIKELGDYPDNWSKEKIYSFDELKEEKSNEIKAVIAQLEQKAQRSSQEITEALLLKQEAKQADIDAFTTLHSAKKINQAKLLEVANATSKEQIEAIKALQIEYKNGEWLEL